MLKSSSPVVDDMLTEDTDDTLLMDDLEVDEELLELLELLLLDDSVDNVLTDKELIELVLRTELSEDVELRDDELGELLDDVS